MTHILRKLNLETTFMFVEEIESGHCYLLAYDKEFFSHFKHTLKKYGYNKQN